jgi:hypothetical protein
MDGRSLLLVILINMTLFLYQLTLASCFLLLRVLWKAHKNTLESEVGYSYRQVLGEIVYAYVVCRLDIGYAATFLSRFSQAPA